MEIGSAMWAPNRIYCRQPQKYLNTKYFDHANSVQHLLYHATLGWSGIQLFSLMKCHCIDKVKQYIMRFFEKIWWCDSLQEIILGFWLVIQLVLATVPLSDRCYYSGSMKTRTWPVQSGFVQNGSLNQVHEYSSDNLVFGTWNMQVQTAHLLVVSDFWYL